MIGPVDCGTCDDRGCSRCLPPVYAPTPEAREADEARVRDAAARGPTASVVALLSDVDPDGAWSADDDEHDLRARAADLAWWSVVDGINTPNAAASALLGVSPGFAAALSDDESALSKAVTAHDARKAAAIVRRGSR